MTDMSASGPTHTAPAGLQLGSARVGSGHFSLSSQRLIDVVTSQRHLHDTAGSTRDRPLSAGTFRILNKQKQYSSASIASGNENRSGAGPSRAALEPCDKVRKKP